MRIKNITKFREFLLKYKDYETRESDFIGYSFPRGTEGEDALHRGFFNVFYNGSKIENQLKTVLNMAQDSQAIFEFVQNAVDCNSSRFHMYYEDDYLIAINNGESFKWKNIISILSLADSTKDEGENIGKFGVGFKLIHRLVGEGNGSEELINDLEGPVLISWQLQNQLEELKSLDPNNPQFELDRNPNNWENENSPWFFKILLTCVPVLPNGMDRLRDLDYQIREGDNALVTVNETKKIISNIQGIFERYKDHFKGDGYGRGSLFYMKLGRGKQRGLEEDYKYFSEGVQFALGFIKRMAGKKGIDKIFFNDEPPIESHGVDLSLDKPIQITPDSEEHKEIAGLLSEADRDLTVQFILAYQEYKAVKNGSYGGLKGSSNFYKYFPMGKEVWNLNFILHCNMFSIETSRREFELNSQLNKGLLKIFVNKFKDLLKGYIKEDFPRYCQLFLSIITSDSPVSKNREGDWIEHGLYLPLIEFAKNNIPVSDNKVGKYDSLLIRNTKLSVDPRLFGVEKDWVYWNSIDDEEIVVKGLEKIGVKKYSLGDLLMTSSPDSMKVVYDHFTNNEQNTFLYELQSILKPDSFVVLSQISKIPSCLELIDKHNSIDLKKVFIGVHDEIVVSENEEFKPGSVPYLLFKIANSFTDSDLIDFQTKIKIKRDEETFNLLGSNAINSIQFEISGSPYLIKLSDLFPSKYKNAGVIEVLVERLNNVGLDGHKLLEVSKAKRRDSIYAEIKKIKDKKGQDLSPWQFIYCANYSLLKGKDFIFPLNANVNVPSILDIYLEENQPFPIQYSQHIGQYEENRYVWPSKYGDNSREILKKEIADWLISGKNEEKVLFLEKHGLITKKNNLLRGRIALLKSKYNKIKSQDLLAVQEKDIGFHTSTIRVLSQRNYTFKQSSEQVFVKYFSNVYSKSHIETRKYFPFVQVKQLDSKGSFIFSLIDKPHSQAVYFDPEFINLLKKGAVDKTRLFKRLLKNGKLIISTKFWKDRKTPGSPLELNVITRHDKLIDLSFSFPCPLFERLTNYQIRILLKEVPRFYECAGVRIKKFNSGNFVVHNHTIFCYLELSDSMEDNHNKILQILIANKDQLNHDIVTAFEKFKDEEEVRQDTLDWAKSKVKESFKEESYSYNYFYYYFQWELLAQQQKLKKQKLRFDKINIIDGSRLLLSEFKEDTIPDQVDFIEDPLTLVIEKNGKKIEFLVTLNKVTEFEITLDLVDVETTISKSMEGASAVLELPEENIIFQGLNRSLFENKLIKEGENVQESFLKKFKSKHVQFIFGPPGTGKSTTIAFQSLIHILKSQELDAEAKILLLSPTNQAADVLIEKMLDILSMQKSELLEYADGKLFFEVDLIKIFEHQNSLSHSISRYGKTWSSRIYQEGKLQNSLVQSSSIKVVSTTIHRMSFDAELKLWIQGTAKRHFNRLVIDESSMVPLAHVIHSTFSIGKLGKKTKFGLNRAITFAGDPFQLNPVGITPNYLEIGKEGLKGWSTENIYTMIGLSHFGMERTEKGNYRVLNLVKQFRSNPGLGQFYSNFKYEDKIEHHKKGASKLKSKLIDNIEELHICKYRIGENAEEDLLFGLQPYGSYSMYQIFVSVFSVELLKDILVSNDISSTLLICSYGAQARILKEIVDKDEFFMDQNVKVGTVHSSQGSEAELVIFVQIAPKIKTYKHSHYNNENLINVAISRAANNLLVITPDSDMLNGTDVLNDYVGRFRLNYPSIGLGTNQVEERSYDIDKRIVTRNFKNFNIENLSMILDDDVDYLFYRGRRMINVLLTNRNSD